MYFTIMSDYENLFNAYKDCCRGKRWKTSTCQFVQSATTNVSALQEELLSGAYRPGDYNVFKIKEPKERIIKSISFRDKVVQRSLCDNVVSPLFERHFIYDNFACRKGKGVHAALQQTEQFMRRAYRDNGMESYVLKCDIEKYFDSIDHEILKVMVKSYIPDARVYDLLCYIIDSTCSTPGKGLPLGNQTSQLFSLFYLSAFDHFVKEKLGIKFYLRYMDDFVLISHDKDYLQYCKKKIIEFLRGLKLTLNHKSHIFPIRHGIDFLGYHIYLTSSGKIVKKVRRASKERMRRKLKHFEKRYKEGTLKAEDISKSWNSWLGHVSHGDTYFLRKNMQQLYLKIFEE